MRRAPFPLVTRKDGGRRVGVCIVIAALYDGEERAFLTPSQGDLLICADRGCERALRHGMRPDLVIGDFDSSAPESAAGLPVVTLPRLKDDTDTAVCVAEGRRRGYRAFRVGGSLGGRLDHAAANLQLSADCALRGETLWLCDARNRVTVLAPGEYVLPRMAGRYLSLLAFSETAGGVNLAGTRWPLSGAVLSSRVPLGVSNEWTSDEARLSFSDGLLTVFFSADA